MNFTKTKQNETKNRTHLLLLESKISFCLVLPVFPYPWSLVHSNYYYLLLCTSVCWYFLYWLSCTSLLYCNVPAYFLLFTLFFVFCFLFLFFVFCFCFVFVLFCFVLFCFVLFCFVLFCFVFVIFVSVVLVCSCFIHVHLVGLLCSSLFVPETCFSSFGSTINYLTKWGYLMEIDIFYTNSAIFQNGKCSYETTFVSYVL